MKKNPNILIIGSGGREHAIGWRLRQDGVKNLLFLPGNAGTKLIGTNIAGPNISDGPKILAIIKEQLIDLVIIGPEDPLAKNLAGFLRQNDVKVIGPSAEAARLETSKAFARKLMETVGVPQPAAWACLSRKSVEELKQTEGLPLVLKVDGLAAGKGAYVCRTEKEWEEACRDIFIDKKFGPAGEKVLVEECLQGEELSVFAICDDLDYQIIGTAQDHKRLCDGDTGPNTGGMGAYSPTPFSTPEMIEKIERTIIKPILSAMHDYGHPFTGFLYPQIMLVKEGEKLEPYVIEINVRLGDPETQVILPLLDGNFFDLLWKAATGDLKSAKVGFNPGYAVTVVKSAAGYPGSYEKGKLITGLNESFGGGEVFQAGTVSSEASSDQIYTNGGRVLAVTAAGQTLWRAIKKVYQLVDLVNFEGQHFRTDIGQRGLEELGRLARKA